MNFCANCGVELAPGKSCAHCAETKAPIGTDRNILESYFLKIKAILFEPSKFFRELPLEGGMTKPLAFALVTHWLGSFCSYLWSTLPSTSLHHWTGNVRFSSNDTEIDSAARVSHWAQAQSQALSWFWDWFWGASSIILDPFKTVFTIFITAILLYVAARLFVNSERQTRITFESSVRIIAYGKTPAILAALPLIGAFVSALSVMIVTIIGIREAYRTSQSRAVLIVLFPQLLFIGIIALGVMLLAILILKFAISIF